MDDGGRKSPADSSESQGVVGVTAPGSALVVAESNAKNEAPDSVPSSPPKRRFSFANLSRKKSEGPTEEEIEAARRARLEAFRREQAEKVRKEMKRREAQWQKDWENMYHSRQKDVLPDGSPKKRPGAAAEFDSEAVRRQKKEERRKKARAKRDKEIMREQRRRIRRREKRKIEAQKKLERLHNEHARWVESEIRKDADLVSGKHLGVEEMLFVVQARNSEACHPAFSGYNTSDDVSRAPCPVTIMHPAFHGYLWYHAQNIGSWRQSRKRLHGTESNNATRSWPGGSQRKAHLDAIHAKRED